MSVAEMEYTIDSNYITELQNDFAMLTFKRIEKENGKFITNNINMNFHNDKTIFLETQIKRILRSGLSPFVKKELKQKLAYFSQEENELEDKIYKCDESQNLNEGEKYAVHNIGHSTFLIQTMGFNILMDPVFGDLQSLLYPAKTLSYPPLEKLLQVNIILISHNHRDHLDKSSLVMLLQHYQKKNWQQPLVFVPMGDQILLKSFGYERVVEVDWFTKISVSNGVETISFVSIPSDHRSGRNFFDHHLSLVIGWIINPEQTDVVFKYSGDTRPLTNENQTATDAILWKEIGKKRKSGETTFPDIVCFEPSGPSYTRIDMNVTHQSASYSVLLKFIDAINIAKISGLNFLEVISKFQTVMVHHNKFELGPDRFNEGLFVFKKLFLYLNLSTEELNEEYVRQKQKLETNLDWKTLKKCIPFTSRHLISVLGQQTSLMIHAKDFIINDIKLVNQKLEEIEYTKECMKDYIVSSTKFPKIGERLNNEQLKGTNCDINNIQKYRKLQH